MATNTCQGCATVNPPNSARGTNPDGSESFLCSECHRAKEQEGRAESARIWDHAKLTEALYAEAIRRNLSRITVERKTGSRYFGSTQGAPEGIRLSPKQTKGIGPFKKTFHLDLGLETNEIVAHWITLTPVSVHSIQEIFRIPATEANVPQAINQATTFIANKI